MSQNSSDTPQIPFLASTSASLPELQHPTQDNNILNGAVRQTRINLGTSDITNTPRIKKNTHQTNRVRSNDDIEEGQ